MHPRQDDVGGHLTDDVGLVREAGDAWIYPSVFRVEPAATLGWMNGCRLAEGASSIFDHPPKRRRPGALPTTSTAAIACNLAVRVGPLASGHGITFGAAGNPRLVDFDKAGQQRAGEIDHGAA